MYAITNHTTGEEYPLTFNSEAIARDWAVSHCDMSHDLQIMYASKAAALASRANQNEALLCHALDSLLKLTCHIDASYTGKEREYQISMPIFEEAHARIGALRQAINLMREAV